MKTDLYPSEITFRDPYQDLIAGCIRGDHRAQLGIYKAYYKPMYNTSLRILKDSGEAELIMQESFLFAFENIESFYGTISFTEWLRNIVVKRSNDAMRRGEGENGRWGDRENGRRGEREKGRMGRMRRLYCKTKYRILKMKQLNGFKIDKYYAVTVILMIAKLVLHLTAGTNYELHRDEMLYFNMAGHVSPGYATVPPVIGFLAFIVKSIFGYSVFGIRLAPALFGTASIFIISRIVKDSGGGIPALIIGAGSFLLSPGFLLFDTLFTPNVIEQFLWLLTTYILFRMMMRENPRLWIWIGILLGISFLTKYSVLFYVAGFFPAMLLTGDRKLLINRYFWYAVIIAFIISLPNLLWQFDHDFPVINHMYELKRTQLDNMNYINFFIDIFSFNLASTIIWVAGLFSLLFMKNERKKQFIGLGSLFVILLFMFSNGKGYYILGVIPFLFAAGGSFLERYLKGRMALAGYPVLFMILGYSLMALPFGLPVLSFDRLNEYAVRTENILIYPFYRWEDGKVHGISQAYTDMTGWRQLAFHVSEAYDRLSEDEQRRCTIFIEANYGDAGAIHFYGKEYNLPEPVTFLESYVFWAPDTIPDGPVIYINNRIGGVTDQFDSITETGSVDDKYFRENGLKVFLCTNPKTDIREVYRRLAFEEKKRFGM